MASHAEVAAPDAEVVSPAEVAAPDAEVVAVSRDEVAAVQPRLADHVRRTPVLELAAADLGLAGRQLAPVVAKLDLLQPTGSFKVRGATALLTDPATSDRVRACGVIAASGGNFGLAIAWAADRLGLPATVVVPATSPEAKLAPIRALGAELLVVEGVYADAFAVAERLRDERGAVLAHAYDQRQVVAGQGTAAAELLAQVPDLDTVLVAVGGGGLLAGTLAAVGGDGVVAAGGGGDGGVVATAGGDGGVRVVAVETEGTATLHAALGAGRPVDVDVSGPAASALGARRIGAHAWAARGQLERSLLVSDAEVVDAQRRLWGTARLVAEPGGATALAALTAGRYRPAPGERVGVIVCGANTDPASVTRPPGRS